ncbi:phage tail spike protein [Salimicrobium jeotgali]|uniref:phage tail spike protein n=1 Tax=Salimicrobium jeotgali TaxID=1230341 RepID=UPI000C83E7DF|nr:phage tail spike protein [Salimicrobium jeotgali]
MLITNERNNTVQAQRKKQPELIHVLDGKTSEVLTVIGRDQPYWNDLHVRELKDNVETFDFQTIHDGDKNEALIADNRLVIGDGTGYYREFIIEETVLTKDSLEVYSTGAHNELKKAKPVYPQVYEGATINTILDSVLYGTGYQRGITDHSGTHKINWKKHRVPYDALQLLPTIFKLELRFRFERDGSTSYRFVDAVQRRGRDSGKEIVTGKDLLNVKRREHTKNQVTALLGIGPENDDGERLVVEVTDNDALQTWGRNGRHKWQVYEPESDRQEGNEMSLEELTRYTRTELDKRKAAAVEYEVNALDIEQVYGFSHEEVVVGDNVRIKATEYSPAIYLDARVIQIETPISDRTQKKFILGEFIEYTEKEIEKLRQSLLGKIANKTKIIYQVQPPKDTTVTWGDTSEGGGFKRYAADVGMWLPQADVTREHTAKDTASVDGRPASTIEDKQGAQEKASQALAAAKADAQTKVNAAQTAAEEYALAKADLAETQAKAHADGKITAEEQARIAADTEKLNQAKTHADQAASNAETAAKNYADARLTNYVTATLYDEQMSDLQAQVDNQVQSHFYSYKPTLSNVPASNWTTTAEKDKHIGDLFFDTEKGHSYRFAKQNGNYRWVQVRDEGIAKALEDAAQAQDTADNKRRTFFDTPTTPYDKGDLWNDNKKIKQSTVTKTDSATFSEADWQLIGDVTGENTAKDTQYVDGRPAKTIEDITGSQAKVDALEISDRNLYQKGNFELYAIGSDVSGTRDGDLEIYEVSDEQAKSGSRSYKVKAKTGTNGYKRFYNEGSPFVNAKAGEKITVSMYVFRTGEYSSRFRIGMNGSGIGNYPDRVDFFNEDIPINEWTKITSTFQIIEDGLYWVFVQYMDAITFIDELKVQRGSKATDWTPAPEDVEADAQAKADQAEQNAKDYSVAETVYNNKMQDIASDLSKKAGITYVDGQLVSKANKNDTYTISEVDNALLNKVSVTKFNTDMNGVVKDLNANSTLIAQNQDAIALKADDTRVDSIAGTVSDNSAQLSVQADEIASKVESSTYTKDRAASGLDNEASKGAKIPGTQTGTWYRIAKNSGNRAWARFIIRDTTSGQHGTAQFTTGAMYSKRSSLDFTLLSLTQYGTFPFSKARIVTGGTYDNQYLDVFFFEDRDSTVQFWIKENIQSEGWQAIDWQEVGAISSSQYETIYDLTLENAVDRRLGTAESSITQQADEIDLRVRKDNVISAINVSPETIRLDANVIEFTGKVFGQGATFKGNIEGGSITSNSTIDVTTNLSVGDDIFIGEDNDTTTKRLVFKNGAVIISEPEGYGVTPLIKYSAGLNHFDGDLLIAGGDIYVKSIGNEFETITVHGGFHSTGDLWSDKHLSAGGDVTGQRGVFDYVKADVMYPKDYTNGFVFDSRNDNSRLILGNQDYSIYFNMARPWAFEPGLDGHALYLRPMNDGKEFRIRTQDGGAAVTFAPKDVGPSDVTIYGNYSATGSKSAIVDTESYGKRKMYAVEAPDVRFMDVIERTLSSGEHWIDLDPMFAETIEGYSVFPVAQDGGKVRILQREATRFLVKVNGGKNVELAAWVYGVRKGYKDVWMEAREDEKQSIEEEGETNV